MVGKWLFNDGDTPWLLRLRNGYLTDLNGFLDTSCLKIVDLLVCKNHSQNNEHVYFLSHHSRPGPLGLVEKICIPWTFLESGLATDKC